MSTIKVSNLQNASAASPAITLAADGSATASLSSVNGGQLAGTRNRIINGDMRIDQRNAGAAVTAETYIVDRWRTWRDQTYSIQQVTDAPVGFTNSLRVTKTNTTQSTYAGLVQYVEGFNASDLDFGTANAATITLSFWVKSSVTGIFTVAISNAAENRWYGATYTINAANTWEKKSVTVAGDTTGTWVGSTNGIGLQLWFNYGQAATAQAAGVWTATANARAAAGSTNLGTTNGATFYLTGVQLEPGSVATPFERRSYGQELALCQRYFAKTYETNVAVATAGAKGGAIFVYKNSANEAGFCFQMPVEMRAVPTIVMYSHAGTANRFTSSTTDQTSSTNAALNGTRAVMSYGTTVIATDCYQHFTCSAEL